MSEYQSAPVEIERKYLVKMPDTAAFLSCEGYRTADIEQVYLPGGKGVTHRIRKKMTKDGGTVYRETVKTRIDGMSAYEDEHTIDAARYEALKAQRDVTRNVIYKTRHTFFYLGQKFEVDVYPFWHNQCVVETELQDREQRASFPPFLEIIREVTGEHAYSNASLALAVVPEDKV